MNDILPFLLSFLLLYKYWALFLVIFGAAIILPFPTNSILLATGAFASQGYFDFSLSLGVAIGGNVLGDCVDYVLARMYGRSVLRSLRVHVPKSVERIETYVRTYPGATIFLTRFVGTVEEFTSVLAGFVGVPAATFVIFDALGNTASIAPVIYAGYYFGINWQELSEIVTLLGILLLGLAVLVVLWILWRRRGRHAAVE